MGAGSDTSVLERVGLLLDRVFLDFNAPLSVTSLACALIIVLAVFVARRWLRGRPVSVRLLWRALFPGRIIKSPSVTPDIFLLAFSMTSFGALLGWAALSFAWVSTTVAAGLGAMFGTMPAVGELSLGARILITLWLYLGYEIGYWLDHWSSHRIPLFWEFHKVHHSAEVLTPLTAFRVHPIESLKFSNFLALFIGAANGVVIWLTGSTSPFELTISGTNLVLVVFIHILVHLQHSQVWIAFTGLAGRLILSPAHHQVHHSTDPKHFDKNFGSCLAICDWLFGTLYVPAKKNENLSYGVAAEEKNDHYIAGVMFGPFVGIYKILSRYMRWRPRRRPGMRVGQMSDVAKPCSQLQFGCVTGSPGY